MTALDSVSGEGNNSAGPRHSGMKTMLSHRHSGCLAYPWAIAALLALTLVPAPAAELQVFGVAPVRSTVTALSTAYQQTSGTEVKPTVVASDIVEKSLAGKTFDVMVLSTPEMD